MWKTLKFFAVLTLRKNSDTEIKSWPRWNSNRVPLDPKSQSFQLSHKALDEFRWLKRLFVFGFFFFFVYGFFFISFLFYFVFVCFRKNSKPIRSCVLGSTSHRNPRALPSRSALGCASGTTLGQRAQVSMLGRTSDAASNIREVPRSADYEYEYVWGSRILTRSLSVPRRT